MVQEHLLVVLAVVVAQTGTKQVAREIRLAQLHHKEIMAAQQAVDQAQGQVVAGLLLQAALELVAQQEVLETVGMEPHQLFLVLL